MKIECMLALVFGTAVRVSFGMLASSGAEVDPGEAVIVSADRSTAAAAAELQTNLWVMTGVRIPIVKTAGAGKFAFSFQRKDFPGNSETAEWRLKDGGVVFAGEYGFAVAEFLENELGIRWPDGDTIAAPEAKKIVIRSTGGDFAPELNIRCIRCTNGGPAASVFLRRMRHGRHDAPQYGHAFTGYWAKYGKVRRDLFGMRKDGIRGPTNCKPEELLGNIAVYAADTGATLPMCCTSTGLVEIIVKEWLEKGKPEYINVCENDVPGQNSCHCPACEALDVVPKDVDWKWAHHYADRYVFMANRVLAEARKHRPDVKIAYYAYNATQDPPAKQHPDPASVIGLVPTYFSIDYVKNYVEGWKKMGAEHFFYRPNRHHYFSKPYLLTGQEEHFFNVLQTLVKAGTIGFDYDANADPSGSMDWRERYILYHAMQDPSKSFDYWDDHYCQAYGAAKDEVKAYFRFWREEVWNPRFEKQMDAIADRGKWFNFGRALVQHINDYYRDEDFTAAEKPLVAAEAKASMLSPSQRKVLGKLRVAHDHANVFFTAVGKKSKANTQALIEFRNRHGFPLYTWSEQYFGDVTGVEALLGPKPKK